MGRLPDQVPIVIGVTGHRDLRPQDMAALEREIGEVFTRLRRDYTGEGHGSTPLILLSALAEGADRVFARVALKMGIKLIAPMPMPIAEYRTDFEPGLNQNAATEFDQLMAQAAAAPVMPFTPGNSLEAIRTDPVKRADQYRAVGLFIVQHCDVLVALWDGNEKERAVGGTAEVIAFKREGIPLVVSGSAHASLDGSEIGPVIHIVTPRMKAGSPATAVSVRPWGAQVIDRHRGNRPHRLLEFLKEYFANVLGRELEPTIARLSPEDRRDLQAWETFGALVKLTREFNGEALALEAEADGPRQQASSIEHLFTDPDNGRLDADAQQRALRVAPLWCRFFGIADALAQTRQRKFKIDWRLVFGFGFAAFFSFTLSNQLDPFERWHTASFWLLVGYTFFIGVVFFLFIRARWKRDQERFLDYRALAEALRIAVYWNILGIEGYRPGEMSAASEAAATAAGTIGSLANCYPIKQPSELAWIKICLRTIDLWHRTESARTEHGMDAEAHMIARRLWVYGQLSYFRRQGTWHNRRAEMLESRSFLLLLITPCLLMPLVFTRIGEYHFGPIRLHDVMLMGGGILPGVAAALSGYSERLALTAQARQYDRMRALFNRAYDLLPETFDESAEHHIRSLYRELGSEAMKESADWVAIYRQRPIGPV
jgi:hypothetical protein